MKVLTAAEMREVDRKTMELGIAGAVLMENAGHRVVEFLTTHFAPVAEQRIVILCGKGNNGGDGMVIARQLFTRLRPASLHVVLSDANDTSDPARMLRATGFTPEAEITPEMRHATLVIDAVLGTGISGPPKGRALELIREINTGFPLAKVLAVDIPSGLPSDGEAPAGEFARADATVTFTALKVSHAIQPNCDRMGEIHVGHIGSPASLYEHVARHLSEPSEFATVFAPREPDSNKGRYGHVLVIGGAEGKTGAAEMAGIAALRAGAGLVTVACSDARLRYPELMTAPLPHDAAAFRAVSAQKNVIAIGPGLGADTEAQQLVEQTLESFSGLLVIDADALNVLAGKTWRHSGSFCVITPHPGEMSRLTMRSIAEIQADRIGCARAYAAEHNCAVVLKGHRTVIALPDGSTWINPTGSPALATAGTGDILTGMVAGFLAQFREETRAAVLAAVYLHGRSGEIGAQRLGEKPVIATDLLTYLPEAMRESTDD